MQVYTGFHRVKLGYSLNNYVICIVPGESVDEFDLTLMADCNVKLEVELQRWN